MAQDWLADVRKYDPDVDEGVVAAIVRHCGIALRTRDASLVSFSDAKETDRVRESFLKKKLARTEDDATLDAAIAEVGEFMSDTKNRNRVTVYYLLADYFDMFDLFGSEKRGARAAFASAAVAGAASVAASASGAGASGVGASGAGASGAGTATPPATTPPAAFAAPVAARPRQAAPTDPNEGLFALALVTLLGGFGVMILASTIAMLAIDETEAPAPAPAPVVAAPEPEPVAIPEGAGVIASEREGKPLLTTYFDTGQSAVTEDFEAAAADILAYLEANPAASVAISGFNDPTGDAEINARLSRERAQNVQAALVALGVDEARTDLVKPDDTTREELSNAEARRVEITIVE